MTMDLCSPFTCHFTDHVNENGAIVLACYYCFEHNYVHICGDERLPHTSKFVGSDNTCLITGRLLPNAERHDHNQMKKKSVQCPDGGDGEVVDDATLNDPRYIFHVDEISGLSIKLNPLSAKWNGGEAVAANTTTLDAETLNRERLYVAKMNAKVEDIFTPQNYARAIASAIEHHNHNLMFYIKLAEGWARRLSSIVQRCYAYTVAHMDLYTNGGGNVPMHASCSFLPSHGTVKSFESRLRYFKDISLTMIVDRIARHHNVDPANKILDARAPSSVSDAHGNLSLLILHDLTCLEEHCMPYLAAFDGLSDPGRSYNVVKDRLFKNYFVPSMLSLCTVKREMEETLTTDRKRKIKYSSIVCPTVKKRGGTRL